MQITETFVGHLTPPEDLIRYNETHARAGEIIISYKYGSKTARICGIT